MYKYTSLALSVLFSAALASAQMTQEKEVTKEKSISTDSSGKVVTENKEVKTKVEGDEKVDADKTVKVDKTYTTRLEGAYRSAGVTDADIVRLRDIDVRAHDYVKSGDKDKVKV